MIKNYLKIAWRNLLRNKTFSVINILGLAIGTATCILIFLFVQYELSYDSNHSNKDRIIRITGTFKTPDGDVALASTPVMLAAELRTTFPEIETASRIDNMEAVVKFNNELFREDNFHVTETELFSVLDFKFKEGSASTCLKQPQSIVLTEKIAKKYFGKKGAIGNTLVINNKSWNVTAVIADPPGNSDIKIDALLSADFSKAATWVSDDFTVTTHALFRNKPDLKAFANKLAKISAQKIQPELDKMGAKDYKVVFGLDPLTEVHFSQGFLDDTPKGNKQISYIFSLLAIFILVIAILNYINLSTARATERAKEVGVRKVNGAKSFQLIRQFLFESLLLICISWVIAIVIVIAMLPMFNKLIESSISFSWQQHWYYMAGAFMITLLLAGLYPAFVLSSFRPVEILKGKWRNSSRGVFFRRALTVAQFVITACLVTGAIVIYSQMKYIQEKDLGFTVKQMLNIDVPNDSISQRSIPAFVNAVESVTGPSSVTVGAGMQGEGMSMGTTFAETEQGTKRELMSIYQFVDKEFTQLFNIRIKEGRTLSDSLRTDTTDAFLVNEAFVAKMGWKTALGKQVEGYNRKARVIGVVKNYYFRSLHNAVAPIIIAYNLFPPSNITIKTEPKNIAFIGEAWKRAFPALPFEYEFLDEAYAQQYKKDKTTQVLFSYFTVFAIFISCMGLYGLVSLMAVHRSKEISVRKVLGASMSNLLALLSIGFIKLIILASLVAIPISWWALNKWLNNYAYHIELSWWMFVLPVFLIILVALMVTAQQILKAILTNPVVALRNE